jgi:FeS assembly protein SufD
MSRKKAFCELSDLQNYSQQLQEPASAWQFRQAAWQATMTAPKPEFAKINYRPWASLQGQLAVNPSAEMPAKNSAQLAQIDGQAPLIKLSAEAQAAGVEALDLVAAWQQWPDLMQQYYGQILPATSQQLAATHYATVNSGVVIRIPAKTKLTTPLTLNFYQNGLNQQLNSQHVLLIAGAESEFSILETRQTLGDQQPSASIVEELVLLAGAKVRLAAIDQLALTTYLARYAQLADNARLDWALGIMNEGNVLADFNTDLNGQGSQSEVKAVAISTGSQNQGITTRITNYGQHTKANILQHGVILSDATLIFNGVGHIVKGARGSDSQQENRVLMLSRTARGDANPILLIDENDVRAGHAASVGRVNQEQMYYLMSRGLSKDLAERLVIRGFLGSVLSEIPAADARQILTDTIERKLIDGQRHRDRAQ